VKRLFVTAACLAGMLLAGCSGGLDARSQLSSAPSIGITQAVWDVYEKGYLGHPSPLAFAVSENGQTYFYIYCTEFSCLNLNSNQAIADSIARCQDRGQGHCVLFAAERSPPRKHHLIDTLGQRLKSP
jgi:hypothetical protein